MAGSAPAALARPPAPKLTRDASKSPASGIDTTINMNASSPGQKCDPRWETAPTSQERSPLLLAALSALSEA